MDVQKVKEHIENAGYETRSYSGRFMYGKRCLGFVTDEEIYAVAAIVGGIEDKDDREDMCSIFHHAKTDNMGRDSIIIYFPGLEYEEENNKEDEED